MIRVSEYPAEEEPDRTPPETQRHDGEIARQDPGSGSQPACLLNVFFRFDRPTLTQEDLAQAAVGFGVSRVDSHGLP